MKFVALTKIFTAIKQGWHAFWAWHHTQDGKEMTQQDYEDRWW